MTFGLGNAGQTFQHDLLTRWREDSTLCIPTVMIFLSSRKTTHSMRSTFTNFSLAWRNMAYLLTPLSALSFWASEVIIITSFLGYQISPSGTKPLESKDEAIKEFPVPKTVRQLRFQILRDAQLLQKIFTSLSCNTSNFKRPSCLSRQGISICWHIWWGTVVFQQV